MPRYRFHVFNNDHTIDDQWHEFADLNDARSYAVKCIRGIMADELTTLGEINLKHRLEIEDEQSAMHVIQFSEAVTIKP